VVSGNSTQLKQVMLKLMLKAKDAMADGSDLLIDLYHEHDGVMFRLQYSCVRMDRETVAQSFARIYSTKREGTGMGLAVTYGIIEWHGGSIQVDSQPGQGTTFTIWLPGATG